MGKRDELAYINDKANSEQHATFAESPLAAAGPGPRAAPRADPLSDIGSQTERLARLAIVEHASTAGASEHTGSEGANELDHLRHVLEHAGELLPAQGPITVFVHHNTLHAFEHLSFHEGVLRGWQILGGEPYLSEDRYRQHLARGRIDLSDLEDVVGQDLGEDGGRSVAGLPTTRQELRLAMLKFSLGAGPDEELRWFVAESDSLRKLRDDMPPELRKPFLEGTRHWVMRDVRNSAGDQQRRVHAVLTELLDRFGESSIERWDETTWEAFSLQALWRICRTGVHAVHDEPARMTRVRRHRDWLLGVTGEDSDLLVHAVLIPFCASFLDQGFAPWPMPGRDEGPLRAFEYLYRDQRDPPDPWRRGLHDELERLRRNGWGAFESIQDSLQQLGVVANEASDFVTATLLALRGWMGMVRQVELRGDRVSHPIREGSLAEFLAIRLILDRLALNYLARKTIGFQGPLDQLQRELQHRSPPRHRDLVERRAFQVFQLAQVLNWAPSQLINLTDQNWRDLVHEIESFSGVERRRTFQFAYDRHYRTQVLDAVSTQATQPTARVANPRFQVVCCIDDREESFRRHIEELSKDAETFGAAGFFSVAMYYRGAADAHYVPLCPVVIRPQHWVEEFVVYTQSELHRRRAKTRKALGAATHQVHMGSRTMSGGALLTAGLGVLASVPLVARVLFPRLTARVRATFGQLVKPPRMTQLRLERAADCPAAEGDGIGLSVGEMATIGERLLRDIGLTSKFARLVLILGHGSNSLNNPHKSAYDCGACGGGAGGPNGRAAAQILNDPRVRERLVERGLVIPPQTVFVGGFHNTCNDAVEFFDLERLPATHLAEFGRVQEIIDEACDRNAHERCRRFVSAPLTLTFPAARRHVEGRAEDLAQARPECGHATNAVCFVGRRTRTRGLFMDRRSFLVSYDPEQDNAEAAILTRIMQAVVPVCGGINLEYYFSYVDPAGWGCSTKLPHNVTGLLGVMEGSASDLRPGLPWQMVEIHEPVRLLFVVETAPENMLRIMANNTGIDRVIRNEWIQLAVLDSASNQIQHFRKGRFEPYVPTQGELPKVATSVDWYRGWRDHLGFAQIVASEQACQTRN